ncbi:MAG TPA: hypothetical protein PK397_06435 [Ignavibacteriaceae bacterium]|nr:hypothetical protein [Ignavibacteriaceae bacterium]
MFNIESIGLSLSFNWLYLLLLAVIAVVYTFYVYRFTIPVVSKPLKYLLSFFRAGSFLLLLFLIFEPIVTLTQKETIQPVNLVFVDNSSSIKIKDGSNREETVKNFLTDFTKNDLSSSSEFYSFGAKVNQLENSGNERLSFNEPTTNLLSVFNSIDKNKNIASISIISDGVITEGTNPVNLAERLGVPVFTIGVGDSSNRNDVSVQNVLFNEYIYAGTSTGIVSVIQNKGYSDKGAKITLTEDNIILEEKNIVLSPAGTQNINFDYTPSLQGEKKLSVSISPLQGEYTTANNNRVFYVNVLSNKIKVLLISGLPSNDHSFIKNALEADTNFTVNSIIQTGRGRYFGNPNVSKLVDSADIFFLIHFPTAETNTELMNNISTQVKEKKKPFFLLLSESIDNNKLNILQPEIPITVRRVVPGSIEVQPNVLENESKNPILQHSGMNVLQNWNNLPPVYMPRWEFQSKPESEILSLTKVNNVNINTPLIVTRRLGSKRSISVTASDIWRWKLQRANANIDLFDRFILNSVKWLNAKDERKQVRIATSKKIYSAGEVVQFIAEVYDESFNPVNDSEVKLKIRNREEEYVVNLISAGNGIYEGILESAKSGDYSFSGEAALNRKKLGTDAGRFNIGDQDIELINPVLDADLLKLLSMRTKGKFYYNSEYKQLFDELKKINEKASKERLNISEISLWSNEWALILLILLFAMEWFIRKREGML